MGHLATYRIRLTPVERLYDTGSEHEIEVVAAEIGTRLWGSGNVVPSNPFGGEANVQGWENNVRQFREAVDSANTTDISSATTVYLVFIKNTGHAYSSATELGATLAKALKVMSGTTLISVLDPNEAIILQDDNAGINCTGIHVRTVDLDGSNNSSAGHLAVEFLVVYKGTPRDGGTLLWPARMGGA